MSVMLRILTIVVSVSLTASVLVGMYGLWQYQRRSESVFARNARLDGEHEAGQSA